MLPARARRLGARLIVSAANLAPVAWPGNVIVLHDAAALREPRAYSPAYRAWHRGAELAAARRARAVITVSEFSRRELTALAGVAPERIEVVPGGVDARFHPPAAGATHAPAAGASDPAADALGVRGPYVLTVATADARKNLKALGPVAAALAEHGLELAWAGDTRGYFTETAPIAGVTVLGHVDDALLPGLYRGARAFVLPSRYEGFGLTCLEAMASGVPVVAADRAALPETCGGAALLVDPDDPRALTEAVLAAAVGDPLVRGRLRVAGLRRAAEFTWERTAQSTDALLHRLEGD